MREALEGRDILCFAGEDWWFHNPHSNFHIMREFARKNRVLFVNSTGIRMPSTKDKMFLKRIWNKLKSLLRYLKRADKNLWVFTPIALPQMNGHEKIIERVNFYLLRVQFYCVLLVLGVKRLIIWVTSPVARDIALHLKKKRQGTLIYYCVDNVSEFPGVNREHILEREIDLQKNSDLALFVSHRLLEERKKYNLNTRFLGHGVDFEHFAKCREAALAEPEDMRLIPRPIVGYMGEILGSDLKLIKYLATRNPSLSFVFVGQPYDDVDSMALPPNVYFIGKRSYDALPGYLKAMACLSFYYDTDDMYNQYRNPKKLLEYLSTGKPTVSVAIHEMEFVREYVSIAKSYEEFERCVQAAVTENAPELVAKRMAYASRQTWEAVAKQAGDDISEVVLSRNKENSHGK